MSGKKEETEERKEFTVRGTTISDEDGKRCAAGSKIMLGKTLAEKFHRLGYLHIPLDNMYKEDQDGHIKALTAELATATASLQKLESISTAQADQLTASAAELDTTRAELDTLKTEHEELRTAIDAAAEIGDVDEGDSVQGVQEPATDADGGEPSSGVVAAGTDEAPKPRRKRSRKL